MSKTGSAPVAPLTRKQLSRAQRERRQRRYIIIATAVVTALVVGVIAFGLFDQAVLRPRQPVARVNDAQVTKGEFIKAARFQRYQLIQRYLQLAQTAQLFAGDAQSQQFFTNQMQQIEFQLNDPTTLGQSVIDSLVDDQLIRQEAARRGITVSKEEVDQAYREFFGFFPEGTPTPTITPTRAPTEEPSATPTVDATQAAVLTAAPTITPTATLTPTQTPAPTLTPTEGPSPTPTGTATPRPTPTPYTTEGYATAVTTFQEDVQQQAGLNEADIRRLLEAQLLRDKLVEVFGQEVATTEDQVHARHILVADEATALQVIERLNAGEDFEALAAELSLDTSNKDDGGDLGWFGPEVMVPEFSEAAFSLPVGEISAPVQTSFGYHIIEVLEREERPLEAEALEQARQGALDKWLEAQRTATLPDGRTVVEVHDNWVDDVPERPVLPRF